jgi:transaldolase
MADKIIDEAAKPELESLRGKAAVANSTLIYSKHLELFSKESFGSLAEKGAGVQRVLWGSTGTKDPAYSDVKYVTELIAKNTVNTLPDKTLDAFLDYGVVKEALTGAVEESRKIVDTLKESGIDVNAICAKLLEDGAASFTKSFQSLLATIEKKASEIGA